MMRFKQARMRQMIDSRNAIHVARRNRVERGQSAGSAFFQKVVSDGAQSGIRTS